MIVKSENHLAETHNQAANTDAQVDNLVSEDYASTSSVTWRNKSDVLSEVAIADLYSVEE